MEFLQALEPWMIPIVVMICVTLIVFATSITKIITTSIKRKEGGSLSENKEFLDALRDFKENIDRRVANLEEIAASEDHQSSSSGFVGENKKKQSAIELELDSEQSREENAGQASKLRNMLNQ